MGKYVYIEKDRKSGKWRVLSVDEEGTVLNHGLYQYLENAEYEANLIVGKA